MSSLKRYLLLLVVVTALVLSIGALPGPEDEEPQEDEDYAANISTESSTEHVGNDGSSGVVSRFLAQKGKISAGRLKCNKFPRICFARGSPGPHCCKKKCVNALKDRLNCGRCGKKCKYNETCCNGKCVNPFFNRLHCGGCNNRCAGSGKESFCAFGLCNYA